MHAGLSIVLDGPPDFRLRKQAGLAIHYNIHHLLYGQMGLRSPSPMNILVVEDNNDFRELLCEMLRMLGHSVVNAASAELAMNALTAAKPDLVITDLSLPGMSGVELARQIHGLYPEIKIILSSGYGLPVGEQFDFKVGVLSKPYSLNQLIQALDHSKA